MPRSFVLKYAFPILLISFLFQSSCRLSHSDRSNNNDDYELPPLPQKSDLEKAEEEIKSRFKAQNPTIVEKRFVIKNFPLVTTSYSTVKVIWEIAKSYYSSAEPQYLKIDGLNVTLLDRPPATDLMAASENLVATLSLKKTGEKRSINWHLKIPRKGINPNTPKANIAREYREIAEDAKKASNYLYTAHLVILKNQQTSDLKTIEFRALLNKKEEEYKKAKKESMEAYNQTLKDSITLAEHTANLSIATFGNKILESKIINIQEKSQTLFKEELVKRDKYLDNYHGYFSQFQTKGSNKKTFKEVQDSKEALVIVRNQITEIIKETKVIGDEIVLHAEQIAQKAEDKAKEES